MAEPTKKSPALNAFLSGLTGVDREENIRSNRCVPPPIGCGGPAHEFRNMLSEKEYTISGLCQTCQDEVFKEID